MSTEKKNFPGGKDPGTVAEGEAVRKSGGEPAKRHGDALLEGNGSRQGDTSPKEERQQPDR